jgi:hypothetical protein
LKQLIEMKLIRRQTITGAQLAANRFRRGEDDLRTAVLGSQTGAEMPLHAGLAQIGAQQPIDLSATADASLLLGAARPYQRRAGDGA